MKDGLHHIHRRRRGDHVLEPFPSNDPSRRLWDKLALVNGIFGSLTPIPQLYDIITTQETAGISLLMWFLFSISSGIWLVYGVYHKDPPIISSSVLSLILYFAVIGAVVAAR